jgi:hypothetical protein
MEGIYTEPTDQEKELGRVWDEWHNVTKEIMTGTIHNYQRSYMDELEREATSLWAQVEKLQREVDPESQRWAH